MVSLGKILSGLLFTFLFLGLGWLYIRYLEKRTIFYPSRTIEFLPGESGLDFEDIFFSTADNLKLQAWFIPHPKGRYTVIFCHGNAGNISHRIEKINFFHRLGCNVFIFDYRGYGRSQGSPSEKGLYIDAASAYLYLLSRGIKPEQLIGYGESLGTAVIIDLASRQPMRALIIDSGFSSGKDMARIAYSLLPYWLFSVRLDSASKIRDIGIPKLIIHSLNDEIVPIALAKKLYAAAKEPKAFIQVRGGHNSCFYDSQEIFRKGISDFLEEISG